MRVSVMRRGASSGHAHCPKLEPLLEHDNLKPRRSYPTSMSQNNPSILYIGLDIAKLSLALDLAGKSHTLDNHAKGHARLLKLLRSEERRVGKEC